MTLNGKRDHFSRGDLLAVGSLIGNFKKEAGQILDEVFSVVTNWEQYANIADVCDNLAHEIKNSHRVKI